MAQDILVGSRIPNVALGQVVDGRVEGVPADHLFGRRRCIVLGVPAAFSPVCTTQHVPDFIRNAPTFQKAGYDDLICIAANDPFVVDAWRHVVDPRGSIRFFSDGNLEFGSALGLLAPAHGYFMGRRSQRYLLVVHDRVVQRVRIEPTMDGYTCTRPADATG